MQNVVTLKHNIISDFLDECRMEQDLLIVCSDGEFICSSFLFASIFHRLIRIVESPNVQGEDLVIYIPDICVKDLRLVFNSIYNKQNITVKQNLSLQFLFYWADETAKVAFEKIKGELNETVKWETVVESDEEETNYEHYQPIGVNSEIDEATEEKPVLIPLLRKRKRSKQKAYSDEDDEDWKVEDQHNGDRDREHKKRKNGLSYKPHTKVSYKPGIKAQGFQYKELVCYTCERRFKTGDGLYEHVFFKHGPHPQMACTECDNIFDSPRALQLHRSKVHTEKITCPDCGKLFIKGREADYEAHMRTHIDLKNIPCEHCDKVFKNAIYLQQHIQYMHEGIKPKCNRMTPTVIAAKCDMECKCGIDFKMEKEKVVHYKLVHLGYKQCPKCNKIVKSLEEQIHKCAPLVKRKKEKVKYVVCQECGQEVHGRKVKYHMQKYHEVVECSCDKCGKKYHDTISLKAHMRDCMKSEQCNICGAIVTRMADHIRNVHTEEKDKKFVCNICGKGFHQKRKLENHTMNIHLKLRPHRCRYGCDIGYNDTSNRNAHEKKKHGGLFGDTQIAN